MVWLEIKSECNSRNEVPETACTATRRKPFTSPFSLTIATRCTRGTGYSRLLRYTNALLWTRERESDRRAVRREKENCPIWEKNLYFLFLKVNTATLALHTATRHWHMNKQPNRKLIQRKNKQSICCSTQWVERGFSSKEKFTVAQLD